MNDNSPRDRGYGQIAKSWTANTPLYQTILKYRTRTSEIVHTTFVLNIRVQTQSVDL